MALRASASETPRLDPEQLALLEEAFDAAVADGDSALDAAMLRAMFVRLGLEPSAADVRLVMAELADPRTGESPPCRPTCPRQSARQLGGATPGSASAAGAVPAGPSLHPSPCPAPAVPYALPAPARADPPWPAPPACAPSQA